MITLCIIILLAIILAIIALLTTGIVAIFWPVLLFLGVGLLIDILIIKCIFKKRK